MFFGEFGKSENRKFRFIRPSNLSDLPIMPETNLQNQKDNQIKQYRVRRSLSIFWFTILRLLNSVLNFFSLKQTKQFWGIVYDSVSKQPLDPVIVKLLYVDGREAETCVTDIAGRYGFLARPGKFKIYVRKTNYLFPSRYAPGDTDGIYENLYHGEFFSLHQDYEVVAPNIPMDPAAADWNQKAKQSVVKKYPYLKHFFKILVSVIFWFGFILDGIFICATFPKIPLSLYAVAGIYLLLLVVSLSLPDCRLWGRIKTKVVLAPGEYLFLELRDAKFPEISFGKAVVKESGQFLLRANKGRYLLIVSKAGINKDLTVLARSKAVIGRDGVLNSTIILH